MKTPQFSASKPAVAPLVCVVDDDDSVRTSLVRLFRSAGLEVRAFASSRAFLEDGLCDGPTCLVLDMWMPGLNGLELQRALACRAAQIVFITGYADIALCAEAMRAGAVDFLLKPVDGAKLIDAVRRALQRSAETCKADAERTLARARLDTLTPRECEVMKCVIAGALNKQIAAQLGAAEKTIKIHRSRMMEKMGVVCVADLVRAGQAAGLAVGNS